jgi:hypothetical protein
MSVIAIITRSSSIPIREIQGKSFQNIVRGRLNLSKELGGIRFTGDFAGRSIWELILEEGEKEGAELIVKLFEEDLFIEPSIIDQMVRLQKEEGFDYIKPTGFPKGVAPEVVTLNALKESIKLPHQTPDAYSDRFKIHLFEPEDEAFRRPELDLKVEREEAIDVIKVVYQRLYKEGRVISAKDAIRLIDKESLVSSPFSYLLDEEPESALIIRTARMWQIHSCIDLLKRAFPKAKVSILAQRSIQDEPKKDLKKQRTNP